MNITVWAPQSAPIEDLWGEQKSTSMSGNLEKLERFAKVERAGIAIRGANHLFPSFGICEIILFLFCVG